MADGAGWLFLSVPHVGATVRALAAQDLIQGVPGSYSGAAPVLYTYGTDWTVPAGLDAPLPLGTGVAWYLFDNDADPSDPDNSASVALPMTLTGAGDIWTADVVLHAQGEGWNLIGNPFPGPLDVSGLDAWAGADALASAAGYVWERAPNAADPVQCVGSYALTGALGDAVPAWHTVFVQADRAGTLTVPAAPPPARRADRIEVGFGLASADGAAADRAAAVVFGDGFQTGWDRHDLEKLGSMAAPSVQVSLGGERDGAPVLLGQRRLPLAPAEVPVYVSPAGVGGEVVLSWPRFTVPAGWRVTLTDRQSGATTDLRAAGRLAVTVVETEARTAGSLRPASDGADGPETALEAPYPNPSRDAVAVRYRLAEAGPVRLTVVDPLARSPCLPTASARRGRRRRRSRRAP